ncbi:unnamed protein product [Calypogeia fissa]
MANSKYEYVKEFEQSDLLLPHTWIVIRIDGRGFTRFAKVHEFEKLNDMQALHLMNECAKAVLEDIPDIIFAIWTTYVMKWAHFFPQKDLQYAPSFDGRAVCYPSDSILRDYLAWRQVDCHINNQYNTCYWNLVKSGCNAAEAQAEIKGTLADFKNELLHSRFQINYNELPAMFRKGSLVFRRREESVVKVENGVPITRARSNVVVVHEDMIRDAFWNENPFILNVGVSSKKVKPTAGSSNERGGRAILQRFICSDQT